jgi:aminodeoxyfutalosine synthase
VTISEQELINLAGSYDIIGLGMMADDVRRRRHGAQTTFVRVADVAADPGAIVAIPPAAGEVRIMGAPASRAAARARTRQVVEAAQGRPVSGFSLVDLEALAARDAITLRALLEDLRDAGLELVAEAPVDRLRDARQSIEQVNIAGLSLARLTVERVASADPLPRLKHVADLQRAVGVVRAFAPLPRRVNPAQPTTGYEDVKHVALARLVADLVPSIQVDWALYGPKLAQVALTMGADDLDGVTADDVAPEGRRRSPLEEVRRNIRAAGQEPVERDGRFEPLRR